jgi:hypothetical protein
VLQPGDHVEVLEGDKRVSMVESTNLDTVTVNPVGAFDLEGSPSVLPQLCPSLLCQASFCHAVSNGLGLRDMCECVPNRAARRV